MSSKRELANDMVPGLAMHPGELIKRCAGCQGNEAS